MKTSKYDLMIWDEVEELIKQGFSSRAISEAYGIPKSTINDRMKHVRQPEVKMPKVLFTDAETAPDISATFGRYDVNLTGDHVLEEGGWLISVSWSWMHEDRVQGAVLTPAEALMRNDYRLVEMIRELINEADIVVGHNIARFDLPVYKARMVINELKPISAVRVIDTLKIAKKMKFNSNKLSELAKYLNCSNKMKNSGISLWIGCLKGDKDSLNTMLEYNIQDVVVLREIYFKLAPWNSGMPAWGVITRAEEPVCNVCGSRHLTSTGKAAPRGSMMRLEVVCDDCGHVMLQRGNIQSAAEKAAVLTSA